MWTWGTQRVVSCFFLCSPASPYEVLINCYERTVRQQGTRCEIQSKPQPLTPPGPVRGHRPIPPLIADANHSLSALAM